MRLRIIILVLLLVVFGGAIAAFQLGYVGGPAASIPDTLSEDQLVEAYVRLAQLAEHMPIGTPEYDDARKRVLAEMNTTPERVEQTLAYYNERPEEWKPVWEKIQGRLTDQLEEIRTSGQDTAASGAM
ncbi:MAG TPA: hypothetical protein VGB22_02805 [candidate division Zixibacteria bacterium]|jgi:hypothetical protein